MGDSSEAEEGMEKMFSLAVCTGVQEDAAGSLDADVPRILNADAF